MVDTRDLKSLGIIFRTGSSPVSATNKKWSNPFLFVQADGVIGNTASFEVAISGSIPDLPANAIVTQVDRVGAF